MGRPPCCDKDGIKKGPWTPEEDIILVSYIQEHGPGNWRSVPTNTGLLRCSKSCRLRWTNYLRPGIKRGNFTSHEEGMIIHLQALLGNKWAAIASYLPQRTDNDIKNYWNTHLKKKLKGFQTAFQQQPPTTMLSSSSNPNTTIDNDHRSLFEGQFSFKRACANDNLVQPTPAPPSFCYASSTENISRLLENWMKGGPMSKGKVATNNNNNSENISDTINSEGDGGGRTIRAISQEEEDKFDSILSFNNLENDNNVGVAGATTTGDSVEENINEGEKVCGDHDMDNIDEETNPPLTFLEKWLLDETTSSRQVVEEILQLPPIF
ncbi:hypothetical protein Cgig2_028177 [Carnegiea gigantea]|uniref:Uncharacterized protein n=1 Tax=Carnegiea gigantea TaxID=171969 RepID=A0A9Q1GRZ4_9CARY|nr:hypothetical protein Cgig2_028177 [Carnegiea gigantea]